MSALDSAAFFAQRATQLGLADLLQEMDNNEWTTMGAFAFASSYQPGGAGEAEFAREVVETLTGDRASPRKAALRRLYFEAFTMVAADMKRRLERTDDDAPRKLPQPERAARRESLQRRLTGISLTGELEPSHALVDLCVQMHEDNVARWIDWTLCTKRDQEVQGVKTLTEWRPDSAGVVRAHEAPQHATAQLGTDLRLKFALQRRGLALEQALCMTFEVHERLVDYLIRAMMQTPPEGYRQVTLDQVRNGDREFWILAAEHTRRGIQANEVGTLPLDTAGPLIMADQRFTYLLAPLPRTASSAGRRQREDEQDGEGGPPAQRRRGTRRSGAQLRRELATLRAQAGQAQRQPQQPALPAPPQSQQQAQDQGQGRGGKARGRGRDGRGRAGKGKGKGVRMPAALAGQNSHDANNRPICFGYNLEGCDRAAAGGECPRGRHVCVRCFNNHPFSQCPGR